MEKLLRGKAVADKIGDQVKRDVAELIKAGIYPRLGILRIGDNPSDVAYERGAIKKATDLGIEVSQYLCEENIEEEELIRKIEEINVDSSVHGLLLLQPLPEHLNSDRVLSRIECTKDLDCASGKALEKFFTGEAGAFAPCTAESCMEILKYYGIQMENKNVVVIGRSMVVGKPVAMLTLGNNANVTICHSRTGRKELLEYCHNADVIISAAGRINMVTEDMVKPGQVIIDVGVNFDGDGKMVGDVDFQGVEPLVSGITPVPGGVGSVTNTLLMSHLVSAIKLKRKEKL